MHVRQAFPGLDLGPLYQDCILRSHERRETYDAIASELCDYGLQWRGVGVDARAYRCRTDRLAIYSMRYGFEHQGRFSQYYREQFGEVPRATRGRLRGQPAWTGKKRIVAAVPPAKAGYFKPERSAILLQRLKDRA